MKQNCNNRRNNSFRNSGAALSDSTSFDGTFKCPSSLFWFAFHGGCCVFSVFLGFRFSRLIFFLIFSPSNTTTKIYTAEPTVVSTKVDSKTLNFQSPPLLEIRHNPSLSRVVVGRHGIRIRPWPHPNPTEVMKAHYLMERVQKEQRSQYGIKNPKPLIVITPTYVRTFQALHLTGLMHTLMLVPNDLTWIVVESGGVTNETASIIAKSGLPTIHVSFKERMPVSWDDRHALEAQMRIYALRIVREKKLDGIIMFGDESNMHSMELFDEIQSVKYMGAVSVGILAHSGQSVSSSDYSQNHKVHDKKNLPLPVQGPSCNSSGQLIGWHPFNSLPYLDLKATYIDDIEMMLPKKIEWSGFVLNSRLVWKESEDKPDWVKDLDTVGKDGEEVESPLSLLKNSAYVEPLGNCGKKILLWWLRVEARADSKFPPGWVIDPPLEITVPSKHTPWPDYLRRIPSNKPALTEDNIEKRRSKSSRNSRIRRGSHGKRKRVAPTASQVTTSSLKNSQVNKL